MSSKNKDNTFDVSMFSRWTVPCSVEGTSFNVSFPSCSTQKAWISKWGAVSYSWGEFELFSVKLKLNLICLRFNFELLCCTQPSEDPNVFLQRRPITSPVLLVESTNLLLAVGTVPLTTLPKEIIHEAPLILLGCYYTFHLTYPKCISTLLSIIQTEVLKDSIHECDLTHSYKKAIAEWEEFNKK